MTQPEKCPALLATRSLRFSYRGKEVLSGIDFAASKGQVTGIIGPNGSGKSTLIKILAGVLRPDSGEVSCNGQSLGSIRRKKIARMISVVPQQAVFHFPFTVFEFVMMGRHPYQGFSPFETEAEHKHVFDALELTGMSDLKDRSVLELSGGEKQRTVLASALAQDTPIMLLDEPTASLDLRYQVQIHKILREQARTCDLTVVVVTHDLNLGALFCDRLVMINKGRIVADGPPAEVCRADIVREHYGVEVVHVERPGSRTPFLLPTGD